jgi:hypothetical protein
LECGPPWRDSIGKHLCRGNVAEGQPVEIWPFKTGLGQGFWIKKRFAICNQGGLEEMNEAQIIKRTKEFAKQIIRLCRKLLDNRCYILDVGSI